MYQRNQPMTRTVTGMDIQPVLTSGLLKDSISESVLERETLYADRLMGLVQKERQAIVELDFDGYRQLVETRNALSMEIISARNKEGDLKQSKLPRVLDIKEKYALVERKSKENMTLIFHGLNTVTHLMSVTGQSYQDSGCYQGNGRVSTKVARLFSMKG